VAETVVPTGLSIESSTGGDDFRTREVRKYFERMGRHFEIYRIELPAPEVAGYTAGERQYHLKGERAGNFRYNSLKVSSVAFYKTIAAFVNVNFSTLEDTVNNDDSNVTGTELLQMIFRQAKAPEGEEPLAGTVFR
jgi:hypothetical protein